MGSLLQNFEGFINASGIQLFSHSFIPLSPSLFKGREKTSRKWALRDEWKFFVYRKR